VSVFNVLGFYDGLLATHSTLKLEDHPLLLIHNCLFSIFTTYLLIWRPFPLSATQGCVVPW